VAKGAKEDTKEYQVFFEFFFAPFATSRPSWCAVGPCSVHLDIGCPPR